MTRRGVADSLAVHALEGMAITQAVERVISAVGDVDPDIEFPDEFEVRLTQDTDPIIRHADLDDDLDRVRG